MEHKYYGGLFEHFSSLQDPRVERTKLHQFFDILTVSICAVICGAETWVDIENYCHEKYEWLRTFIELPNGVPSHDTFARVFARVDPEQFQTCFVAWMQATSELTSGKVVAIDGKTLRGSDDKYVGKAAIHMVSAWASANRLVLGQVKVDDKSNEITAIPELLQMLELTGCLVTIDAMGCQKEIAALIVAQEADYILAVKGNQEHLHEDIQAFFAIGRQNGFTGLSVDYHETYDEGHGRNEIRRYWSSDELGTLRDRALWKGLNSIGMVESVRQVEGKISVEVRHYISSLEIDAKHFGDAVRTHWGIENSVHWVLDVAFREDESRIRKDHAPENFALLRHMALNLLRQETTFRGSFKSKRLKAGWNDAYLARILGFEDRVAFS